MRIERFSVFLSVCFALAYTGSPAVLCANKPGDKVTLPPVIVAASRIPSMLERSPGSITIITRQEIEQKRPSDMADLLSQVAGLHIDQPGGRGSLSSVYLRGSDPNLTLVFIDGVRVNNPTNSRGGSFDLSTLNVENIERVEIIQGPLSAVHGSDALAGVINIVTRESSVESMQSFEVGIGTEAYLSSNAEACGPIFETSSYSLSASYVDDGSPVKGSEFIGSALNGKLNIFPSLSSQFKFAFRYSDSHNESFPDDSGGPEFAVLDEVEKRDTESFSVGFDLSYEPFDCLELNVKGNFYDVDEDISSPGVAPGMRDPSGIPPNNGHNDFRRTSVGTSGTFWLHDEVQGSVGLDLQFEEGTNRFELMRPGKPMRGSFEMNRHIYSPSIEMQYSSPIGLIVQGGLRVDVPEDFDTQLSPRIGALYRMAPFQTTLRGNWGKGFKLPSFFALSNPIVGNPNLRPESSESFDLGVTKEFKDGSINLTAGAFCSRFFDIIDLAEGPPPELVNRSEVTAKGIETGLTMNLGETLFLNCHLTYTKTDIKDTDEELRSRPKWRGGMLVKWELRPYVTFTLDVLYVGDVLDSAIPTGDVTLDDYIRMNVSARWKMSSNWQALFAVDNLCDANYEEAVGFPATGIRPRFYLTLVY